MRELIFYLALIILFLALPSNLLIALLSDKPFFTAIGDWSYILKVLIVGSMVALLYVHQEAKQIHKPKPKNEENNRDY